MTEKYILDGHNVVPADWMTWSRWAEKADRTVAKTDTGNGTVSTTFLLINNQSVDGQPLFFETRVFGGPLVDETDNYSTWEEAEAGHAQMVERVNAATALS